MTNSERTLMQKLYGYQLAGVQIPAATLPDGDKRLVGTLVQWGTKYHNAAISLATSGLAEIRVPTGDNPDPNVRLVIPGFRNE